MHDEPLTSCEYVSEQLVCLLAVLVLRLSLETVCPVHLPCLMVATVDVHAVWVKPWQNVI